MHFLINFNSLKTRIIYGCLIATAVIGFLLTNYLIVKFNRAKELKQNATFTQNMVSFTISFSNVVHELQKERGLTAGYFADTTGKSTEKLKDQYVYTDAAISTMQAILDSNVSSKELILNENLSLALEKIASIHSVRGEISTRNISLPQAINFYTETNNEFITVISLGINELNDVNIKKMYSSVVSLIKAKESGGLERASLNNAFTKNSFTPPILFLFLRVKSEQDVYLKEFKNIAPEKYAEKFENEIVTSAPYLEVEALRIIALDQYKEGHFGIPANQWFKSITAKLDLYKGLEDVISKDLFLEAEKINLLAKQENKRVITFIITGAILSVILLYILYKTLSDLRDSFITISQEISEIANGNLKRSFEVKGLNETKEILSHISQTKNKLNEILTEIKGSIHELNQTSANLVSSSNFLKEGSTTQAANIEEIAATVEEITSNIEQNFQHVTKTTNISNTILTGINSTNVVVKNTMESMQAILSKTQNIEAISRKTNILAINASIEAARVGQLGKGFAVVAGEVRALAETSQQSSVEIDQYSTISFENAEKSVHHLDELIPKIEENTELISQIKVANQEQLSGINQINQALSNFTRTVNHHVFESENVATEAENLALKSKELENLTSYFTV